MLVVGGVAGLAVGLRRARRRRSRTRRSEAGSGPPEVPVTRLTVIRPGPFADVEAAEEWLRRMEREEEPRNELVSQALAVSNRALHAHRLATLDPHGGGVSSAQALARRIGFGTGDELADGRFSEAIDVPAPAGPRARVEALRPQERLAATLGRRAATDPCETLILRARADIDGERMREGALQLRVGLEALLAEVSAEPLAETSSGTGAGLPGDQLAAQVADLETLAELRAATGEAAGEALRGELSASRAEEVVETVRLCERVLRRRRVLSS